jgi:hypothetical protein
MLARQCRVAHQSHCCPANAGEVSLSGARYPWVVDEDQPGRPKEADRELDSANRLLTPQAWLGPICHGPIQSLELFDSLTAHPPK